MSLYCTISKTLSLTYEVWGKLYLNAPIWGCNLSCIIMLVLATLQNVVVVVVVVVVSFFNHNFVNCKATLILAIKIYEIKYNKSLNDIHT